MSLVLEVPKAVGGLFQSETLIVIHTSGTELSILELVIKFLHYLKDPKLWKLRRIPHFG